MAGPFLGVELPDKFETVSSESAPEVSDVGGDTDKAPEENQETPDKPDGSSSDKPATAQVVEKPADLLDLDKHERVRFKGREYSVQELRDSFLRHEDYTRKVQQSNEVTKYARAFENDLEALLEDPSRLGEFKQAYAKAPKSYIRAAERLVEKLSYQGATPQAETQPGHNAPVKLDPESQRKLDRLLDFQNSLEERVNEARVAQDSAQIETWFDEYSKKYPSADVRWVNFEAAQKAEQFEANGKSLSKEDTKSLIEKCFKDDHDAREKQFNERVRSLNQKQKAVARKGQDMGSGGGVPSSPSQKPKTFKEATALMEKDLESGRLS